MQNSRAHLEAAQRVAAHFSRPDLRHYVGVKLRTDPVYAAAFEWLGAAAGPILDIGCGLGLLEFYLRERGFCGAITGVDRDGRKIRRAAEIGHSKYGGLDFHESDVQAELPNFSGNIVLFDLLHYLSASQQKRLLTELAGRVSPDACLLIRDAPRDGNFRYWVTLLAEVFAQSVRWNVGHVLHFPTRQSIAEAFDDDLFSATCEPLWGGTPFNNHLFVFRRRNSATVPVRG